MRDIEGLLSAFPNAEIGVESDDVFYANYDVTKNWPDEPYTMAEADFAGLRLTQADKMLISLNGVDVHVLKSCLPANCYLEIADGVMGMVMNKQATKWDGIVSICDDLGIRPSEVVCFGDDHNDISMIQGCGVGVAVENANAQVLEVADEVCLSNEHDGPAVWMRQFVLELR